MNLNLRLTLACLWFSVPWNQAISHSVKLVISKVPILIPIIQLKLQQPQNHPEVIWQNGPVGLRGKDAHLHHVPSCYRCCLSTGHMLWVRNESSITGPISQLSNPLFLGKGILFSWFSFLICIPYWDQVFTLTELRLAGQQMYVIQTCPPSLAISADMSRLHVAENIKMFPGEVTKTSRSIVHKWPIKPNFTQNTII